MSGPSNRTIIGVAILLFGGVLLGVGIHHLVATGNCSSSGYNRYGPVKYCPAGTGWWFAFVFGGIILVLIGAFSSGGSSVVLLIPAIFGAVGLGAMSIALDAHPSTGSKIFGLAFGGSFTAVAAIVLLFAVWSGIGRLRSRPASGGVVPSASAFGGGRSQPDAILGAYAAASASRPIAPATPGAIRVTPSAIATPGVTHAAGDGPLEKIAKLADLRDKGALTEDEFNREKAKLLGEL